MDMWNVAEEVVQFAFWVLSNMASCDWRFGQSPIECDDFAVETIKPPIQDFDCPSGWWLIHPSEKYESQLG